MQDCGPPRCQTLAAGQTGTAVRLSKQRWYKCLIPILPALHGSRMVSRQPFAHSSMNISKKKAGIQYGSRPFYTPVKGSELFLAEVDLRGYAEITIGFTRDDVTVRTAGAA